MGKILDLVGKRFGRLLVIEKGNTAIHPCGSKTTMWVCKCNCGKMNTVSTSDLNSGHTKSCGCLSIETAILTNTTHGKHETSIYYIWCGIKARCFNCKDEAYHNYGGRGITMCDEWKNDFMSFYNWAMANGYDESKSKKEQSIDRINNGGNYEPSNCRWATWIEQSNNKRNNIIISYKGRKQTLPEWCEELGLIYSRITQRIFKYGWDVNTAFEHNTDGRKIKRK